MFVLFVRPNCYAPAVRQVPQAVHYGNPCDISPVTGPCYAKLSYPCTAQLIPCSVAQQMPVAVAPLSAAVGAPATSHSEDEQYDGLWSEWSSLTACSVTCGVGVVQRRRVCSIEGHCFGEAFREEACERGPCPASASPDRWSTWSEWTSCSRSCGVGKQERERVCETGRNCLGSPKDIRECNVNECERWSEWGEWSLCTPSCGPGSQKRYRQNLLFTLACNDITIEKECVSETSCSGSPSEQRACDSGPCGAWTEWHSWTDCSRSCGSGVKTRSRTCIGQNCVGDDFGVYGRLGVNAVLVVANVEHELEAGTNNTITLKHKCDVQFRYVTPNFRQCLYKDPGQSLCDGPYEDESNCPSLQPCEEWSEWREWSPCTVSCGHGNQVRVRVCLPPHLHCKGNNRETRGCNEGMCPYWNNWSEWSECSVTCGAGTKTRTRICVKDDIPSLPNIDELIAHSNRDVRMKNAAKAVLIESSRNRLKNGSAAARHNIFRNLKMKDYPLENYMINHFGLKSIERKRNVDAGSGCYGSDFDRQLCYRVTKSTEYNLEPCCELTQWSQWTECSATCGGGRRTSIL
uniref:Thrombospondin type 1 domain protein n=1 Tax=Syphacia muris TaxID=451379 RepID=A0A0N5AHH5_9BILA